MADIKLDTEEESLFNEVGSRGDYYREAVRDKAAEQVRLTGRPTEITTDVGDMLDVVMPPQHGPVQESVTSVVPPSDFEPVAGIAPGADPNPSHRDPPPEN
jgi:hypothetical protein